MGLLDIAEGIFSTNASAAATVASGLKVVPGASEVLSGMQAVYHTGSAVYDGVTGDRDGAINHGTQAVMNAAGMIPGVGEGLGMVDLGLSATGMMARPAVELAGGDASNVPVGLGDLAGNAAVAATNMIFGKDDSNWIAANDTPQGTRGGEIGAGLGALLGLAMPGGPIVGGIMGGKYEIGKPITEAANGGVNGRTSGADGNWWSKHAQNFHDEHPHLAGLAGGAILGALTPLGPGVGALAGWGAAYGDRELKKRGYRTL